MIIFFKKIYQTFKKHQLKTTLEINLSYRRSNTNTYITWYFNELIIMAPSLSLSLLSLARAWAVVHDFARATLCCRSCHGSRIDLIPTVSFMPTTLDRSAPQQRTVIRRSMVQYGSLLPTNKSRLHPKETPL